MSFDFLMKLISINNVVKTTILRALHKQLLSPTIPTPILKQLSFYLFEKFEENSVKVFVKDKPDYLWKTIRLDLICSSFLVYLVSFGPIWVKRRTGVALVTRS